MHLMLQIIWIYMDAYGWIVEQKESLSKFAPIMKMLELLIILQLELIVHPI